MRRASTTPKPGRGSILAQDREGHQKQFPLLSASAVLVELDAGCSWCSVDDVSTAIASQKKAAKASPGKIAVAELVRAEPRQLALDHAR